MTTRISERLPEKYKGVYMKVRGALAFAMAFVLIATLLINGFAYASPSERYVDVNDFQAETLGSVDDGQEVHHISTGYDAAETYYADVELRLVHVPEGEKERTVQEWQFMTAIQGEEEEAGINVRPPSDVSSGEYRYEMNIKYNVERFVEKEIDVATEPFHYEPPDSDFRTDDHTVESHGGFEIIPGTIETTGE